MDQQFPAGRQKSSGTMLDISDRVEHSKYGQGMIVSIVPNNFDPAMETYVGIKLDDGNTARVPQSQVKFLSAGPAAVDSMEPALAPMPDPTGAQGKPKAKRKPVAKARPHANKKKAATKSSKK